MNYRFSKKTVAAVVAGTFIFAGAIAPFIVQAASPETARPAFHQRQVDPEKAAARIAQNFGISQDTITKYQKQGYETRDLAKAAFLAKASGKSFESVIALKTKDNKWKDVSAELGLTKEQLKATRQTLTAERISAKFGVSQTTVKDLLADGYKGRDIAMASLLSKKTERSVPDIIQLKKINNTWGDVAEMVGVDKDAFKSELKELRHNFHRHGN